MLRLLLSQFSLTQAILVFILAQILYRCYVGYFCLRDFSGPRFAAFTRLWIAWVYARKNAGQVFLETNQKHGRLARVGPRHLLTNDLEITCRVLGSASQYQRGTWFDSLRFHPHYASIASETDPSKHDKLRAKVSAGYNTREFTHLEKLIDTQILAWLSRLRKIATSASPRLDIARSVRTFTMDLSARICFSTGLKFDEDQKQADEFWESLEENAPYAQYISTYAWLFSLNWLLAWIPGLEQRVMLTEQNNPGVGRVIKYSRIAVQERFTEGKPHVNDMLGSWIRHGLSQHESETEASIAMVTGAFPTASTINVALLHVWTNPRVHRTLVEEVDKAAEEMDPNENACHSQINRLPYLQACVYESLRCFPPITQLRERVVPPGGDTLDGRFVPAGTKIGLNTRGLQQHDCFKPDPDVFRPERWLEVDDERGAQMKKVHGLIFGYGSTKCLGITQAFMVITKILFEFTRNFDIEIVRPYQPWVDQNSGVSFHKNLDVTVRYRRKT